MIPNERLQSIHNKLLVVKHVNAQELAEEFGVSLITVRRDLDRLTESGVAKRVYGGAVLNEQYTSALPERPNIYNSRSHVFEREKAAIGKKAAEFAGTHSAVFLDIGTTVAELAKALVPREDLTIVTNSLSALEILADSKATVLCTGGQVRSGHAALFGDMACTLLKSMRFDQAFLGAGGVSADCGITYYYPEQARIEKTVIQNAAEVTVLADSSKIGASRLFCACTLENVRRVITDTGLDQDRERMLTGAGIEVVRARPDS